MSLASGTRLGPYEIQSSLGAGGMGEVYRARDTRLDRTVAVKILPAHLSSNPEAKQRFEREARAISSLNHPNICTLHDVGHQDGTDFLVMEYLEGETLADRLAKGPLPAEQVLKYGIDICEGLEKAHKNGVIHRDLKPGNIMLTKSGAKLMDFGLAKTAPAQQPPSSSLTITVEQSSADQPLTARGMVVGTFQYMSPEQVEGKDADARSDIFALGAVLYEMASGKRAFTGKSQASIVAAILASEPQPISAVQPMSPPALDRVVRTCLAKEPDERWQTVHDVKLQLRWIAESGSQSGLPVPLIARRRKKERAFWIAGGAFLALVAAYAGWSTGLRKQVGSPVHLTAALPPGITLLNDSTQPLAISPDGSTVVFSTYSEDRKVQLYLRKLDSFESTQIIGTEGGASPCFSPDGAWLGFVAENKLKKVSLQGGSSSVVTELAGPIGCSWADDDTIYFQESFASGIYAVPAAGGQPRQVTKTGTDDRVHIWPTALPRNTGLIFTVWSGKSFNEARIEALSFKTGKRKVLVDGGTDAHYLPSGYLAYGHNGTLLVVGFDPDRLELKGTPVPMIDGVMMGASNGDIVFGVSRNGTLVYQPGSFTSFQRNLVWMDRSGKPMKITDDVKPYSSPAISPDGKLIALTLQSSTFDVWIYDPARDTLTKASFGGDDYRPTWSPDGKTLAYDSSKSGNQQVYVRRNGGLGPEQVVTEGPEDKQVYTWSADGREVIFGRKNKDTGWDVYATPMDGNHKPRPLLEAPFNQTDARVSPNGKWLAYVSNESGQDEIFVQATNEPGLRVQVSREGGDTPRWTRSGEELIYLSKKSVMSVKFSPGVAPNPSKPVVLFEDKKDWAGYDVAKDGRLVVAREAEDKGSGNHINVVLHWLDEVKAKVK